MTNALGGAFTLAILAGVERAVQRETLKTFGLSLGKFSPPGCQSATGEGREKPFPRVKAMTKHDMGQFLLPPVRRDQLHDDIALALDAISDNPTPQNLAEARSYLRHALRLVKFGGAQ